MSVKKIYVIIGTTGEYEDKYERIIKAFTDITKAEKHLEELVFVLVFASSSNNHIYFFNTHTSPSPIFLIHNIRTVAHYRTNKVRPRLLHRHIHHRNNVVLLSMGIGYQCKDKYLSHNRNNHSLLVSYATSFSPSPAAKFLIFSTISFHR